MTDKRSEQLDETIDRVAGALTFVAHDPGFAQRIADRLNDRTRTWWSGSRMLMAGAAVAMVIVVARVAIDRFAPTAPVEVSKRSDPVSSAIPEMGSDPIRAVGSGPFSSATPETGSDPVSSATPEKGSDPISNETASDRRFITHERLVPQLVALPSPEPLNVAVSASMANPVPLTVQPVKLAPLDLASLELTESDASEYRKE